MFHIESGDQLNAPLLENLKLGQRDDKKIMYTVLRSQHHCSAASADEALGGRKPGRGPLLASSLKPEGFYFVSLGRWTNLSWL
jgi:hypothetical protein